VALSAAPDPSVLDTLAAAHAAAGRYGEAARVAEQALQLAESAGPPGFAAQIRSRLALYRAGRPYQE
jgi:spermidine synthase